MQIRKTFTYGNREHEVVLTVKNKKGVLTFDGVKCENVKNLSFSGMYRTPISFQCAEAEITINEDILKIYVFNRRIYILKDDVDIETDQPFDYPSSKNKRPIAWLMLTVALITIPITLMRRADLWFHGEPILENYLIYFAAALVLPLGATYIGINRMSYFAFRPLLKTWARVLTILAILIGVILFDSIVFLAYGALAYGKTF